MSVVSSTCLARSRARSPARARRLLVLMASTEDAFVSTAGATISDRTERGVVWAYMRALYAGLCRMVNATARQPDRIGRWQHPADEDRPSGRVARVAVRSWW